MAVLSANVIEFYYRNNILNNKITNLRLTTTCSILWSRDTALGNEIVYIQLKHLLTDSNEVLICCVIMSHAESG